MNQVLVPSADVVGSESGHVSGLLCQIPILLPRSKRPKKNPKSMGRPIALGSTIAHAYNKLRSVKVEIPQNNFVVSVKAVPQVLSSCACTFQQFYVS